LFSPAEAAIAAAPQAMASKALAMLAVFMMKASVMDQVCGTSLSFA
jgi:hypothetical protein